MAIYICSKHHSNRQEGGKIGVAEHPSEHSQNAKIDEWEKMCKNRAAASYSRYFSVPTSSWKGKGRGLVTVSSPQMFPNVDIASPKGLLMERKCLDLPTEYWKLPNKWQSMGCLNKNSNQTRMLFIVFSIRDTLKCPYIRNWNIFIRRYVGNG